MPGTPIYDDLRDPSSKETPVTHAAPTQPPYIRHASAPRAAYPARAVAAAYGMPIDRYDGTGATIGIVELGGAYNADDMRAMGLNPAKVTCLSVDGGQQRSDGPNGADGEVMLDVEIAAAIAPGANVRVYFASNDSDSGFLDAIRQAGHDCDVISISWGGPESSWDAGSIKAFSSVFASLRKAGIPVFAAAGDAGSRDGTARDVVDYPASDPSVIGCGGTRLALDTSGHRSAETVWDDDPTRSATGGGVSGYFPGRTVPDVAGNADPETGWQVVVDGQHTVVGGTSAVAPAFAAGYALLLQAHRARFDFLNLCLTNPSALFDVTLGNNGGYKAGPGRDDVSGLGVPDFGRLLSILGSDAQIPAPGGNTGGTTVTTNQPPASTTGSSGGAPVSISPTGGPSVSVLAELENELESAAAGLVAVIRKFRTALGG